LITQEYLHLQDLLQESSQQLNNHQKLSPQHEVKQEQWQTNSLYAPHLFEDLRLDKDKGQVDGINSWL
jgi:hypothetical protein